MRFKVINAGKCMLCGKPIKIVATKDNDLFPSVFFCLECEKKAESGIHCNCTDAEIAKSFIEDVEAVKDLLPQESEDKE